MRLDISRKKRLSGASVSHMIPYSEHNDIQIPSSWQYVFLHSFPRFLNNNHVAGHAEESGPRAVDATR